MESTDTELVAIHQLLQHVQKQEDESKEHELLQRGLAYLLKHPNCWWCTPSLKPITTELLHLFSIVPNPPIQKFRDIMAEQLSTCKMCVNEYHDTKPQFHTRYLTKYSEDTVNLFFKSLEEWDAYRIAKMLMLAKVDMSQLSPLEQPGDNVRVESITDRVMCTLFEIFKVPIHLKRRDIDEAFISVFCGIIQRKKSLKLETKLLPGVLLLLVHESDWARRWAQKTVSQAPTSIDCIDLEGFLPYTNIILALINGNNPNTLEYNITEFRSEHWKALRLLLSSLTSDAFEQFYTANGVEIRDLILSQLPVRTEYLIEMLRTFSVLLLRLQNRIWSQVAGFEYARAPILLFKSIMENQTFISNIVERIQHVSRSSKQNHSQNRKLIDIFLEWVNAYIASFKETKIWSELLVAIVNGLFTSFQSPAYPDEYRTYCKDVAVTLLLPYCDDEGFPITSHLIEVHGNILVDCSIGLATPVQDVQKYALQILELTIKHDVELLYQAYLYACQNKPLDPNSGPMKLCKRIWSILCSRDPSRLHQLTHQAIFYYFSRISLIDLSELIKTLPNVAADSVNRFVVEGVQFIRSLSHHYLAHFSESSELYLQSFFQSDGVPSALTRFLISCDPELRSTGYVMVGVALNADSKVASIRALFALQPDSCLSSIIEVLEEFSILTRSGCNTYSYAHDLFDLLHEIVSAACEEQGGPLDAESLASSAFGEIMVKLWNCCWDAIKVAFKWGLSWAEKYRKDDVIGTIGAVFNATMAILRFHDRYEGVALHEGSTLTAKPLKASLPSLIKWFFVTNDRLRELTLNLVLNILDRTRQKGATLDPSLQSKLEGIAMNLVGFQSSLTEDQRTNLFIAISGYQGRDNKQKSIAVDHQSDNVISIPTSEDEHMEIKDDDPNEGTEIAQENAHDNSVQAIADDEYIDLTRDNDDFGDLPDDAFDTLWHTFDESNTVTIKISSDAAKRKPSSSSAATPASAPSSKQLYSTLNKKSTKPASKSAPQRKSNSMLKQMRSEFKKDRSAIAAANAKKPTSTVKKPTLPAVKRGPAMSNIPPADTGHQRTAHKVENLKPVRSEKESDTDSSDESDSGGGLADIAGDYQKPPEIRKAQPRRGIQLIDLPNIRAHPLELRRARMASENQTKARLTPDLSHLHKFIFGWKYTDTGDLPTNITLADVKAVPKTFESSDEYTEVFEPLLLLECWQQLVRAKEETNDSEAVECTVVNRIMVDGFHDITFSLLSADAQGINDNDLVHIFRQKPSGIGGAKVTDKSFLCKVQSSNTGRDMTQITVRSAFGQGSAETLLAINPKTSWKALKLFSLTTIHREYSALQSIGYYNLCDDILHANSSTPPPLNEDSIDKCMKTYLVNQPQAEAILHVLRRDEGFSLIQGPPGTGKTKTILGLIGAVLSSSNQDKMETHRTEEPLVSKKILVCAPSNAAVDELVKRLKDGIRDSSGAAFKPKVVRIGIFDSINSSAKEMSLEYQVEKEMNSPDSEYSKSKKELNNASGHASTLKEEMKGILKERDELRDMISRSTDPFAVADMEAKVKQLNSKRWNLAKQLDGENDKKSTSYRALDIAKRKIRTKILTDADIVCSTLSGSGHEQLTSLAVDFETVIIDEAAQSIELSSLIPLKYGCKRCVLVGDPNQLPPTVLSQVAASYSYEQSLFVRIQNHCPNAVHLLSIQYRMHPEISAFPSKLFYDSKLRDGPNLAQIKTQKWHQNSNFSPYNFFNVHSGREEVGRGKSLFNSKEAEVAVALVHHLCKAFPTINFSNRIGIITPYKQQLRELRRRFESAFGQTITQLIDFNTVDGFQGQEKDIIIFSCVRAGSSKGIGFLADIRRMNVGLTRARYSLFILGNSKSLLENKFWRPLIEDAKERKRFVDCDLPLFGKSVNRRMPSNLLLPAEEQPVEKDVVYYTKNDEIEPIKDAKVIAVSTEEEKKDQSADHQSDSGSSRKSPSPSLPSKYQGISGIRIRSKERSSSVESDKEGSSVKRPRTNTSIPSGVKPPPPKKRSTGLFIPSSKPPISKRLPRKDLVDESSLTVKERLARAQFRPQVSNLNTLQKKNRSNSKDGSENVLDDVLDMMKK